MTLELFLQQKSNPNTLKYIEKNMQDNTLSDSVQKELEYIVQMLPNEEP